MYEHRILRNPAGIALRSMQEGNFSRAEHEARRALEMDPKGHEAPSMLAYILHQQNRSLEAVPLIERALALDPKNGHYHDIAGQIYLGAGDLRKAALSYERAQRLLPGEPAPLVGRAEVLYREKRLERGLSLLEPFIKRCKEDAFMAATYGRICRETKDYQRGIEIVTRHLNDVDEAGHPVPAVLFALGQLLESAGDYRGAMDAYIKANAATPSAYDPEETQRTHRELRETFTREFIASAPKPSNPSNVPVFVIGMPRSGSTLTEQIIHAHTLAFGAGELCHLLPATYRDLALKVGSTLPVPQCARDLDRSDIDALAEEYLQAITKLAGEGKARIVDKCLGNDVTVGLIALLFPTAHIIHIRRDAIDNCLACFSRNFPRTHPGFTRSLESLGFHYRAHHALMDHWKQELDYPILTVDYEELVADQERISRQMIEFIGLEWDDNCLAFHKEHRQVRTMSMHQVDKPIYTTAIGRAERFGELLDPLRKALAGE